MKNSLPRLMLVTERRLMLPDFETALRSALDGGARLIQLREKDLKPDEFLSHATATQNLCVKYEAALVINPYLNISQQIGAGFHAREGANIETARDLLRRETLIGASAHSLDAARRAQASGADYVVFGSIFPTASHPGSTPVGLDALKKITEEIAMPVFAIGGITIDNARACLDVGAHGVAVIRAVWATPDVRQATRELLELTDN